MAGGSVLDGEYIACNEAGEHVVTANHTAGSNDK